MTDSRFCDVAILGGGLAGLTLALQLKQSHPTVRAVVVERQRHPLPEATCKVGESTVEVAAHYFADVLGLQEHIDQFQLPKLGLRCFFGGNRQNDISKRVELGANVFFPRPTYQLDRGRFENFLRERCIDQSIDWRDDTLVRNIELSSGTEPHKLTLQNPEETLQLKARWIIDASGRSALLRKKLNLQEDCSHHINAAWFRIADKINIDDWCDDSEWTAQNTGDTSRWFSTNQLMGAGYWVWIIPLASDHTSIGIVADPRYHQLNQFNSLPNAVKWLQEFEPQLARALEPRLSMVKDFLALKNFSRKTERVFSPDRWALMGDAGVFIDPLYSPGADFIAFGNTFVCDLVTRDLQGKRFQGLTEVYNDLFLSFTENTFQVYQNQYSLLGNSQVMPLKIIWDFATYWSFFAFLFNLGRLCDIDLLARFEKDLQYVSKINSEMQRFFLKWHDCGDVQIEGVFLDLSSIDHLWELNDALTRPLDQNAFEEKLAKNIRDLASLGAEMIERVKKHHPMLETPTFASEIELDKRILGTIFEQVAL